MVQLKLALGIDLDSRELWLDLIKFCLQSSNLLMNFSNPALHNLLPLMFCFLASIHSLELCFEVFLLCP